MSAESSINEIDILKKISDHIKSVGKQLTLHPPSSILDEDKKKILKNLYESGMEEDAIADQLDLDVNTVRDWIK